jgi:CRISPR-associated exonuclease Cas4
MEINAHVLEGQLRHEQAHTAGKEREGEVITLRRVYLYSERLRAAGFADLIEITGDTLAPVEYKKGRMGKWLNDHIQLCAQALCLEERLSSGNAPGSRGAGAIHSRDHESGDAPDGLPGDSLPGQLASARLPIGHGFIFYFGSRRREQVDFDERLRAKTVQSIEKMWEMLRAGKIPPPLEKFARCRDCSLEPICLPREVRQLNHSTIGESAGKQL